MRMTYQFGFMFIGYFLSFEHILANTSSKWRKDGFA